MEWYELLLRSLHAAMFAAIPVVLLVTVVSFVLLGAVLFLAGVVLRAYDGVRVLAQQLKAAQ